ncbi:MAG: LCP family protein [Syntrophomonadaceae bacterium]|jgi:LCP family protein required for cell wall assembly|nr:LCP family protein [Syntrophomonadaceae bacterium]
MSGKKKWRNVLKSIFRFIISAGIIFGVFFAIGIGVASYIDKNTEAEQVLSSEAVQEEEPQKPLDIDGPRINILALGVDSRNGEEHSRSDTMILASIDPDFKKIVLVSIPRDTQVTLKGSREKICTANFYGGPKYAVSTVESLMGIKIDHYVLADFKAFESIIDIIGGVTIDVPQRMYKPSEGINLQSGAQQLLNGHDALAYVRFRDYANGDIERTQHQQLFLRALTEEMLKPVNIVKAPYIAKEVNKYLQTDMSLGTVLKLATWVPFFSKDSITAQTLPGYFYDERDARGNLINSFWLADAAKAKTLVDTMFTGEEVAVFQAGVKIEQNVNAARQVTTTVSNSSNNGNRSEKETAEAQKIQNSGNDDKTAPNVKEQDNIVKTVVNNAEESSLNGSNNNQQPKI